jgi:hypothetical protein
MKLVAYKLHGSHHKNKIAFKQLCDDMRHEYKEIENIEELPKDTDLIWSPLAMIHPDSIPKKTKILFGPQFFTLPDPRHPLFYFDLEGKAVYNCLSEWVKNLYEEFVKGQRIPFAPCPFPVDTKTFSPKEQDKEIDVLIYFKYRDNKILEELKTILSELPIKNDFIKYGEYKETDYINLLNNSKIVLWIGCHESQGFAFQEALSMNKPILCYDVKSMLEEFGSNNGKQFCCYEEHRGKKNLFATSATSWSAECGEKTHNMSDIPDLIIKMLDSLDSYKPREFVLKNLSSEACWKKWSAALGL